MAEDLLQTQLDRNGSSSTLAVTGELDVASGPALEHAVARVLDGQGEDFRLDLSALTFMDSTGARSLVRVHHRLESLGRRLVLVSPTPPVRRVIELLGLEALIDVEE
jgi:stage II sporulation protein AA (anti-sigma F factor antagonist)